MFGYRDWEMDEDGKRDGIWIWMRYKMSKFIVGYMSAYLAHNLKHYGLFL
jgi:hypothetical protein